MRSTLAGVSILLAALAVIGFVLMFVFAYLGVFGAYDGERMGNAAIVTFFAVIACGGASGVIGMAATDSDLWGDLK